MKMKSLLSFVVRSLVLSVMAVPVLSSCAVGDLDVPYKENSAKLVANYKVYGNVSDEAGDPIPGIMVVADYSEGPGYQADTLYTDKEGRYSKFITTPNVNGFNMSFIDIDGPANGGAFKFKNEYVTPILTEMSVGNFGGSYIVSVDVTLEKK